MDVVRLHWPEDAERRADLHRRGVHRLLLVAAGEQPPRDVDVLEDWAREGAAEIDVAAREVTVALRAARLHRAPHLDHGAGGAVTALRPASVQSLNVER